MEEFKEEDYSFDGLTVDLSNLNLEQIVEEAFQIEAFNEERNKQEQQKQTDIQDYIDENSEEIITELRLNQLLTRNESNPDTRKKVEKDKYRSSPYANLIRIGSVFKDPNGNKGWLYSSGVLVGPRHVLTAHYNIHQKFLGDALSVEAYSHIANVNAKMIDNLNFGLDPEGEGLKYYKDADLALLILDKPLGLTLGYLPMVAVKTTKPLVEILHISGHSAIGSFIPLILTNEDYDMRSDIEMIGCSFYAEVIGKDKKPSYYVLGVQSSVELKGTLLTEERLAQIKNKIAATK